MMAIVEAEAQLTSQSQITIPAAIRKALKLKSGQSRVRFQLMADGRVVVTRADMAAKTEKDPALKPFLELLEKDMKEHPERIKGFPVALAERIKALVEDVDVDLDGALTGED